MKGLLEEFLEPGDCAPNLLLFGHGQVSLFGGATVCLPTSSASHDISLLVDSVENENALQATYSLAR